MTVTLESLCWLGGLATFLLLASLWVGTSRASLTPQSVRRGLLPAAVALLAAGGWWATGLAGLVLVVLTTICLGFLTRRPTELEREARARLSELQASEEHYRLISENTGDVIWKFDLASGRFTYISPSVQRMHGYTQEEALALTMQEALTPESYQSVLARLAKRIPAFEAGDESMRVQTLQVAQPRKDKRIVQTEFVTTLLLNAQGRATTVVGVARDITARKQAEQELQETNLRLEQATARARRTRSRAPPPPSKPWHCARPRRPSRRPEERGTWICCATGFRNSRTTSRSCAPRWSGSGDSEISRGRCTRFADSCAAQARGNRPLSARSRLSNWGLISWYPSRST